MRGVKLCPLVSSCWLGNLPTGQKSALHTAPYKILPREVCSVVMLSQHSLLQEEEEDGPSVSAAPNRQTAQGGRRKGKGRGLDAHPNLLMKAEEKKKEQRSTGEDREGDSKRFGSPASSL